VTVHLPSKMHQDSDDQAGLLSWLADDIARVEQELQHTRTVVVGDFNMNPFEVGLISSVGLHAAMTRDIARAGQRTVQGRACPFFYNPMWGFFGDTSAGPPGTYRYDRSGRPVNYCWNIFDQVLVRPALLDSFKSDRVAVLSSAGDVSLLSRSGRPTPSDHLPIVFQIDLEKE